MKTFVKSLILLVAFSFATHAIAYDFMVDSLCYNINSDSATVTVTYESTNSSHYSSLSGEIVIPEMVTYNNMPFIVTSIGNEAFMGCMELNKVDIPNSVTSIGDKAFSTCRKLAHINIPNSVIYMGSRAFENCNSLDSLVIPTSVSTLSEQLFWGCTGLKSIRIPNSITSIGHSAFHTCVSLTDIDIPNSVVSIGNGAFYQCLGLTKVIIPESVVYIGGTAFGLCVGLTTIFNYINHPTDVALGSNVFASVSEPLCTLHVIRGRANEYRNTDQWRSFNIIDDLEAPLLPGDVNGDGRVNVTDVTALVNMILGVIAKNEQTADVNGDGRVNVSDVTALINLILGVQGWVPAGTCSIFDKTWNEGGQHAEGVPIEHLKGTNQYRIVSPLVYLYDGVEDNPDDKDFLFMIDEDGEMTVKDGLYMDWWGSQMYYTSDFPQYCYVEKDGNTYKVNFLLVKGASLYLGGYFEFTWDR